MVALFFVVLLLKGVVDFIGGFLTKFGWIILVFIILGLFVFKFGLVVGFGIDVVPIEIIGFFLKLLF